MDSHEIPTLPASGKLVLTVIKWRQNKCAMHYNVAIPFHLIVYSYQAKHKFVTEVGSSKDIKDNSALHSIANHYLIPFAEYDAILNVSILAPYSTYCDVGNVNYLCDMINLIPAHLVEGSTQQAITILKLEISEAINLVPR